jgi:hypothetical protein
MFNSGASYGSSSRHSSGGTGGGNNWVGVDMLDHKAKRSNGDNRYSIKQKYVSLELLT